MKRTVKQFILENALAGAKHRLNKLNEMNAPKVMIEGQEKLVLNLEKGNIQISGDKALLDIEFETFSVNTGNMGKKYVTFDNGIKYFPKAKFGMFVTK